jgi:L-amino acid N-acyltransferase YncA
VIRALLASDWPAVEAIYASGIATGHATFEVEPPSWEQFDATRLAAHRLVFDDGGEVRGWAAASPASSRAAYRGVVEHSVYVAESARAHGVGAALVDALIDSTVGSGIWTIQSSIFPENTASLALHASSGFRVVGTRERIGLMEYGPLAGIWRDTVLIERRAP